MLVALMLLCGRASALLAASEGETPSSASTSPRRRHPRARPTNRPRRRAPAASSCHTHTDAEHDAPESRGEAGLHRLPRRRRNVRVASGAQRGSDDYTPRATRRTCCRAIPKSLALSRRAPTRATATRCSTARARSSSASSTRATTASRARRAAPATSSHPGGRAQPDGDRRDVLGRRVLQQRHPAVQALHPRRGLHARRRAGAIARGPATAGARSRRERSAASLPSSIRCRHWEIAAARRHLPRVRARRPQHRQPVPRDRPARTRPASSSGSRSPAGPTSRQSNRGPGTGARIAVPVLNIHKTRLNDPLHVVHGHQRPAGRLPSVGLRRVPRRLRQRPRSAALRHLRAVRPRRAERRRSTRRSARPSRAIRCTHAFTRAIPTSQCMICHMHQPNMFVNTLPRLHHVGLRVRRAAHVAGEAEVPDRRGDARGARPQSGRRGAARQVGATWISCATCPSSTRS